MTRRSIVVSSRYWHHPQVRCQYVHGEEEGAPYGGVEVYVEFEDLVRGALAELAHPVRLFTRAQLERALRAAFARAITKLNESSVQLFAGAQAPQAQDRARRNRPTDL
jgi:hypothetical protein